jgi:hypothetical protein
MRFPHVVLLSACALMWTATLLAQSPNGVINGLVLDPSTRIIVSADVVIVNDVTGMRYTTKTNGEGIYVLPNLPPGPYRLQISKIGFKTIIKPDIVLNLQDALSINFTLPIGASYETVTVEAGASMINTTDASVSTVIDQTYVKNMPLNGRSFQDLILLTPGVVTQSPQNNFTAIGQTGEFSVNGQRQESNYYTVDGVSASIGVTVGPNMVGGPSPSGSVPASTVLGTTQALVSVDDLQEFRVQSSSYSAEFGRNPGGQFAFETKSGTNRWHGTAYDYLRNGFFDAQDWFNDYFGTTEPALRQNDFGGTLGGPFGIPHLYSGKDKTFFFVSYEGLRLAAPQAAAINYVPDVALRSESPASLQPALNAFPVPNGPDVGSGVAEYVGTWSNPSSLDSTSVRFDHTVSNKLRLFFRFSETDSSATTRGTYARSRTPTSNQSSVYTMRAYTTGATSILTSRFNNDFRLNYSSNEANEHSVVDAFGGGAPANLALLSGLDSGSGAGLALYYGGYDILLYQDQQAGAQRQWHGVDTMSLSVGHHQIKFGVDYRRLAPFDIPSNPEALYYYFSEAAVQTNNAQINVQALSPGYPLYTNFSVFAQDEWRLSPRLSLSLGLRWEVNPAPGVTQGLKPYTLQGSSPDTMTLAPQGTPLWQTTWFNVAPRLGAAYVLRNSPRLETVVRGGVGVFFDTGQQLGSLGLDAGPGFGALSSAPGSFPEAISAPPIVNPPVTSSFAVGYSPHLQLPYTLQWNASIEQALGQSQALTVSYVGSHASRLLVENYFIPANNPNFSSYTFVENGLTSDYDSMQLQFRRRLSQGLTALASYTWSHCLDYGSQNYLFAYQRGNCDFDVRQNLSAAFSYEVPDLGHKSLADAILDRWGIDSRFTARTGFPVTLGGFGLLEPNGQFYDEGLNLVPGQPVYLYGANCAAVLQGIGDLQPGQECPGGRAINPNAFTNLSSGLGDAPRNFARGFGIWQMDLAIRRDFPIRERLRLQFRAEAFNVFNHPNFGNINGQSGTSTFGQATSTLANSLGILSPLYQQGGPRSMQFALKLTF